MWYFYIRAGSDGLDKLVKQLLSSLTTSVHSFILSLKGITSLQIYNVMYLRGYQQKVPILCVFPERFPSRLHTD
jgi:hypothetical protein